MKKILITGAGGFIGSHLTEYCVEHRYQVKAFLRYNSNSLKGWLKDSPYEKDIEFVFGDIRDFDSVARALKDCDTVFHLAALIGIPYSYESPVAYIKTNVEGTYNVLESAKQIGLKNILITSTSETYGTAQYVPIDEKHPVNAQSPYAASKAAADQLALSYHRSFDLPVKIIRPFNTFGPRQSMRAIIPTIITQLLKEDGEIKLGNTTPIRDFTFVKDTISGFAAVANSQNLIGEATNIGTNQEVSIKELAHMVAKLLNKKIKIIPEEKRIRPDKSEVERLLCQNEKICRATQWKPTFKLEEGLKETIEWIESRLDGFEAQKYHV